MSADWAALTLHLRGEGAVVTMSWRELEDLVGGMPASSINHQAWWGGDRPHIRAWKAAGYTVASKRPGVSVTFRRENAPSAVTPEPPLEAGSDDSTPDAALDRSDRLLLVTCVKSKTTSPAAAKDLYVSPLFRKARAYAERSELPWFIVTAEHGLVQPDEWLAPYERYLPDMPREYRTAWGEWVVARLELLAGPLRGRTVEMQRTFPNATDHPFNTRSLDIESRSRGC